MADPNTFLKKDERWKLGPKVEQVTQNHARAKRYYQKQIDNQLENWRFYYGKFPELGLGQYRYGIVNDLQAQGRQLLQFNFIKPTVDTLAGSLLRTKFDPDFIPLTGGITGLTEAAKAAARSDKEVMDWNQALLEIIVGGLIAESAAKMGISDKYNDLGNINLEYALPGSTIPDPLWKTAKSTDCRRVWHESWLTATQLMRTYPEQRDLIQFWATREALDGIEYGEFKGITPFDVRDDKWGNVYRVIEEYCVMDKEERVAYMRGRDSNGDHNGQIVNIPGEVPDPDKGQWLDARHPGWKSEDVKERIKYSPTCYLRTACPTLLQKVLLQGEKKEVETEVQTGGTPWKFYASSRHNGEPHGIVDAVKDPQEQINYDMMMITDKMQTEGSGGGLLAKPDAFQEETGTGSYQDFVKNRNNKRKVYPMRPDVDLSDVIKPIISSKFPVEVYKNLEMLIGTIWPRISKVTPASMGMQEEKGMSGKLYNMLKVQTDNAAYTLHESLRNFYNDFYESYLKQFVETYGNEGIEREFTYDRGRENIKLNERITLDTGQDAIRNDVRELRKIRHLVLVSDMPESPSQKAEDADTLLRVLEVLYKNPQQNMASIKVVTTELMSKVPQLSKEALDRIMGVQDKELELEEVNLDVRFMQAQLMKSQLAAQLQGGMPGQPGAPGAPGAGGGPAEMPAITENKAAKPPGEAAEIPLLKAPQAQGA